MTGIKSRYIDVRKVIHQLPDCAARLGYDHAGCPDADRHTGPVFRYRARQTQPRRFRSIVTFGDRNPRLITISATVARP